MLKSEKEKDEIRFFVDSNKGGSFSHGTTVTCIGRAQTTYE
jgi:hypothetical protein